MNSDALILRQNNYPPLINKGAQLDSDDFDNNNINIYKDLEALNVSKSIAAYSAGTTYDDTIVLFASYGGRTWQWVNASPGTGVTPVAGLYWQEVFPTIMAHRRNSDTILDEGGANEISAADIVAGLALADATTDLAATVFTPTTFTITSSTGTNAILPQATQLVAGILSAADKVKLDQTSGTNTGDQTLISLGAEAVLNKVTSFSTLNDTLYPSVLAVETRIQTFAADTMPTTLTTNLAVDLNSFTLTFEGGRFEMGVDEPIFFANTSSPETDAHIKYVDSTEILTIYSGVDIDVQAVGDLDLIGANVIINSAYTLPSADGTASYVLTTNGAGVVTWAVGGGVDTSLSDTDQVIDELARTITLFGDGATAYVGFNNLSGNSVLTIAGNQTVFARGSNDRPLNTAFGELALVTAGAASTTSTAFGYKALTTMGNAGQNSAFGHQAGRAITTGQKNTCVGNMSGDGMTGASDCVAVGVNAGLIGAFAARATMVGAEAGINMGTCNNNTMIGYRAGYGVTTGQGNTFLGTRSATSSGVTTGSYNVVIGMDKAIGNVSNHVVITDGQANQLIRKDATHNQILGIEAALATTATDGFPYFATCAGVPTGVPTAITGKVPVVIDSTNNKMYIYSGGAWVALN